MILSSISDDTNTVSYTPDIVGWEEKTILTQQRFQELDRMIRQSQPGEGGLYSNSEMPGGHSLNLIHIQRLIGLNDPFSISNLIKISDGKPYSTNKQSPGGCRRSDLCYLNFPSTWTCKSQTLANPPVPSRPGATPDATAHPTASSGRFKLLPSATCISGLSPIKVLAYANINQINQSNSQG